MNLVHWSGFWGWWWHSLLLGATQWIDLPRLWSARQHFGHSSLLLSCFFPSDGTWWLRVDLSKQHTCFILQHLFPFFYCGELFYLFLQYFMHISHISFIISNSFFDKCLCINNWSVIYIISDLLSYCFFQSSNKNKRWVHSRKYFSFI